MNVTTIGLDIAKSVFHVVGSDKRGRPMLRKQLRRAQVLGYFANFPPSVIGLESCGGSQYWARELGRLGHEVRLIPPKYVKPFLRGNKTDYNDAAALCEAVVHPQMRYVPIKSEAQQDVQALHRLRDGLVKERTVWSNRVRGLLGERGLVIARGRSALRRALAEILADGENGLSDLFRLLLAEQYERICALDEAIAQYERRLAQVNASEEACQRLDEVPGFGAIIATALVAAVGDAKTFKNARQLSAWVGLVPAQHSTGGKPHLLGISKRGDKRLRALIIHGARAVVRQAGEKSDPLSRWIQRLRATHASNVVVVALANKLVRIAWVILSRGERYRAELAAAHTS